MYLKDNNDWQIHNEILIGYGSASLLYGTVLKCKMNFQNFHLFLADDLRCGRPSQADDIAEGKKMEDAVLLDRKTHLNDHE